MEEGGVGVNSLGSVKAGGEEGSDPILRGRFQWTLVDFGGH